MGVTFGRALAAAIYLIATVAWAAAMGLSSLLGCEGGCFGDERHRLDVSLILGFIGLALAAGTLLGSLLKRWVGLSFLALHIAVFAINLGIFWGLADAPWTFIPAASLAAVAGYFAVAGLRVTRADDQRL
jgi:hypothetical protein